MQERRFKGPDGRDRLMAGKEKLSAGQCERGVGRFTKGGAVQVGEGVGPAPVLDETSRPAKVEFGAAGG
jgi:hypothetical protein